VSIDEELRDRAVDFHKELGKKKCAVIYAWLSAHYSSLMVERWKVAEKLDPRLQVLRDKTSCCALFKTREN
jgi:hypothetical protein